MICRTGRDYNKLIMDKSDQFLFELLETPSPTGFEVKGQRVWAEYVGKHADEVSMDAYGNTWAWIRSGKPEAKVLMLEAHADEIGYMIKYITPEGFLKLDRVGGSDAAVARGRRLRIFGSKGEVFGITGNTAIHLRKGGEEKAPTMEDIFVDVGAKSDKEVAKMGLRVGHVAVYQDGPVEMQGGKIVCRALDNRIGGYILAEVIKRMSSQKEKPQWDVVFLNAVQEEIGGNGAKMATHRLRPDAALCLDVTHATDTPGLDKGKVGGVTLGGGPSITHGSANHPLVVEHIEKAAEKAKITLQHEASSRFTGTDTDKIFISRDGVPSALISLPLRYMHSPVEMVDRDDVEATIELLIAFIMRLEEKNSFHFTLN